MGKEKILIIEDDKVIARLIKMYLDAEGYTTELVFDGSMALDAIKTFAPDIVLLDLMLPGMDGVEICRQARAFYNGMILVLTASVDEMSEVSLFKFGADDYVTKPVKGNILLARVEALLRRSPYQKKQSMCQLGFTVDSESKRAFYHTQELNLTPAEFDVFQLLYQNYETLVTREECCKLVRGIEYCSSDRTVDMRISGLRRKLLAHNVTEVMIKTLRNKGYMLVDK